MMTKEELKNIAKMCQLTKLNYVNGDMIFVNMSNSTDIIDDPAVFNELKDYLESKTRCKVVGIYSNFNQLKQFLNYSSRKINDERVHCIIIKGDNK